VVIASGSQRTQWREWFQAAADRKINLPPEFYVLGCTHARYEARRYWEDVGSWALPSFQSGCGAS
jgi:hypothetical protein